MTRLVRVGVAVILLATVAALDAPAAWACSCASPPWDDFIGMTDASFVGTLREGPPDTTSKGAWTFEVESVHTGELGPEVNVLARAAGPSCGLSELRPGTQYGVMLTWEESGVDDLPRGWHGNLCSVADPDALAGLGDPHPPDPAIGPGPTISTAGPPWPVIIAGAAVLLIALVMASFVLRRRRAGAA
jgi:hypothetical protein